MHHSLVLNDTKKRKCVECGKDLSFFEGYRHPTLGIHALICQDCYVKVETSVERWGRFVLWNSFNPDAPDPTYIDNFPFPHEDAALLEKKWKHRRHFY